jgi:hypothetical protein
MILPARMENWIEPGNTRPLGHPQTTYRPSRLRTDVDPGTCGGLVPQKDPDKEGQQEAEDPIPVEYIQDKAEND